jgi:hypothetical protein
MAAAQASIAAFRQQLLPPRAAAAAAVELAETQTLGAAAAGAEAEQPTAADALREGHATGGEHLALERERKDHSFFSPYHHTPGLFTTCTMHLSPAAKANMVERTAAAWSSREQLAREEANGLALEQENEGQPLLPWSSTCILSPTSPRAHIMGLTAAVGWRQRLGLWPPDPGRPPPGDEDVSAGNTVLEITLEEWANVLLDGGHDLAELEAIENDVEALVGHGVTWSAAGDAVLDFELATAEYGQAVTASPVMNDNHQMDFCSGLFSLRSPSIVESDTAGKAAPRYDEADLDEEEEWVERLLERCETLPGKFQAGIDPDLF